MTEGMALLHGVVDSAYAFDAEDEDMDALHILPLRIIPLRTVGLQKARLVKNLQLKGQVELFSDKTAGSGQIDPKDLGKVFQFDERNRTDLVVITRLATLPSYDVYSLRVSLRRLGIEVESHGSLALSDQKSRDIAAYMRPFLRPLLTDIYGTDASPTADFSDIIRLFSSPEVDKARQNLLDISRKLEIELTAIPAFLADYGDTYLSLAYYQSCLDRVSPILTDFLGVVRELKRNDLIKHDVSLVRGCSEVETKLEGAAMQVADILEVFLIATENMWEEVNRTRFTAMARMIGTYQTKIGGGLCALTVKLREWARQFPSPEHAGPHKLAHFVAGEMRQGIELVEEISFEDKPI